MKIAVLNFEHAVMSSVAGPFDMLSKTNDLLQNFQFKELNKKLEVELKESKDILLETKSKMINAKIFDLVIIPAMDFDKLEEVLENEKHLFEWIKWQFEKGSEIASICLGAFILAKTDLLNEKIATTHWMGASLFRQMFPKVELLDDKIITDYNGIYTSGGAYSFTSLMVYLVEKFFGHEIAILISKIFLIHLHDSVQDTYTILNLQKNHGDNSILKIQEYIESRFTTNLTIDDLAQKGNMSKRSLMRNFKMATGNTPIEYLQKVRIEKAKKLLEQNEQGVEQVALDVGYNDFSAFRKVFKRNVGITPNAYKKRYGKMFLPDYVEISA